MIRSEPMDLDFSLTTPGFFLRPDYIEVLGELRRRSPVHRTADGLVAISRYEDVRTISRDPTRFVSGRGVLINDPLRDPAGTGRNTFSILHLDPPLHATYRTLVNRQFTPRAVARLRGADPPGGAPTSWTPCPPTGPSTSSTPWPRPSPSP